LEMSADDRQLVLTAHEGPIGRRPTHVPTHVQ
jgi:hypothetical protein